MRDQKERIERASGYSGVPEYMLAAAIGKSQANFSQLKARKSISESGMQEIATAMGAQYEAYFIFPDGTRI